VEGEPLPVPEVKKGKWAKERERTKSGRWRKKRSDANKPRKKRSALKYALAIIGVIALALLAVYFFFPKLLGFA
jgi:hypothetical protein